jgi:hypothetical protein
MRKQWVVVLLILGFAKAAFAQTVRGTVVVDGNRPVSGVVVALVDATSREVARALTNAQGEYRLVAPGLAHTAFVRCALGINRSLRRPSRSPPAPT